MPPDRVIAELEKKVARLETALDSLLDALVDSPSVPLAVAVAAGEASNLLKGLG